jgi:hypothetical protein
MNKVKVAIQDLRNYLGTDRQGVALLDKVAEIADSQRKRAASLEGSVAGSDAIHNKLRLERDAAINEAAVLRGELERERATRSSLESKCSILADRLAPKADEQCDRGDRFSILLKNVRKRFKKMPARKGVGIVVEDFIKTFSYDEFAGLGMVAAAVAMTRLPFTLTTASPASIIMDGDNDPRLKSKKLFSEREMVALANGHLVKSSDPEKDARLQILEAELARFTRWFRDAIDFDSVQSDLCRRINGPEDNDQRGTKEGERKWTARDAI